MTRRCFMFDLDGTLCNGTHRVHHIIKSPKNWDAYFSEMHNDTLIEHVADVANALSAARHKIVYVSGRPDNYRNQTVSWIIDHLLPIGPLYMRAAGDHRNDDIIKIELLSKIRADGFDPVMVFDDRSRVVKAWRSAGIPCAQVADGDF